MKANPITKKEAIEQVESLTMLSLARLDKYNKAQSGLEALADDYIELTQSHHVNIEFFGEQMIMLNATVALQAQQIKQLEKKLELRKVH